jgi:hypothetical protein
MIYNPLYDVNEESIGDMLNDDLNIDSDDQMDLEIDVETAVRNRATNCQKVRVKQVFLHVDGWATRKPMQTYLLKMQGHNLTFCHMLSPWIILVYFLMMSF